MAFVGGRERRPLRVDDDYLTLADCNNPARGQKQGDISRVGFCDKVMILSPNVALSICVHLRGGRRLVVKESPVPRGFMR